MLTTTKKAIVLLHGATRCEPPHLGQLKGQKMTTWTYNKNSSIAVVSAENVELAKVLLKRKGITDVNNMDLVPCPTRSFVQTFPNPRTVYTVFVDEYDELTNGEEGMADLCFGNFEAAMDWCESQCTDLEGEEWASDGGVWTLDHEAQGVVFTIKMTTLKVG